MKFKRKSNFSLLRKKLVRKRSHILKSVRGKHSKAVGWLEKKGHKLEKLAQKGTLSVTTTAATGLLLLSSGTSASSRMLTAPTFASGGEETGKMVGQIGVGEDKGAELAQKLEGVMPKEVRTLTTEEEKKVEEIIENTLGVKARAELEGKRLNTDYAFIGGEQHLYRFPGDTLDKHFKNLSERRMFYEAGLAPSLGAWGYFTRSEATMTQEDVQRERYYVAVQTFLTGFWKQNAKEASGWFKYRKVIVVNPKTGQAVVAVVGDSGPATYTGKSFGGSPELMHAVGLGSGPRRGEAILLFVDDPQNLVPLGPANI